MLRVRWILTVVLLLALGLGTPMYSMQASDIDGASVAHQSVPEDCDACGSDEIATTACLSGCIGVQVVLPRTSAVHVDLAGAFGRFPERQASGLAFAPDPFPPKLTILA